MKGSSRDDDLLLLPEIPLLPSNIDRRSFLMRNAVIGAAAVMTGTTWTPEARAAAGREGSGAAAVGAPPLSPDLDVVKKSKGPVMTVLEEFYKVGPGPSSSHTIGPMRITYDFYQRCTKLPADQLAKATGLKVHLFGSLSATGKGHGTERASLAGLMGKEPATVDPLFLDEMIVKPEQTYPVKLGDKTFNLSLADIIYDAPKGDFPHPNTMTCKLMAGDKAVYELEYYSPGGGFIEWKGYTPPKKGQPKYPYATMKELRAARGEEQALDRASHHGERSCRVRQDRGADQRVPGQDRRRDAGDREGGPRREGRRPARPDQAALEGGDRLRAGPGRQVRERPRHRAGLRLRPGRFGGKRPRPPGHHRADGRFGRRDARQSSMPWSRASGSCPWKRSARVCSPARPSATCASTTPRSPGRRAVVSPRSASLRPCPPRSSPRSWTASPQVIENAAESALEHHLGMTCDPVAGYVQVPCIERCAFGAVKAWIAFMIATNEIASRHRVDLDTTIKTLAQTGRDMSTKYKETSEAGLAANLVLC